MIFEKAIFQGNFYFQIFIDSSDLSLGSGGDAFSFTLIQLLVQAVVYLEEILNHRSFHQIGERLMID